MEIGIVGKTNTGKSSFFKAATLIDVEIAARTFVTIKPNIGVGYVTAACPHGELGQPCRPANSKCVGGTRLIPVKLWDVAGLVPGAHAGRGLGNQFLNDIVRADGLIHIIDVSGTTDAEGRPTEGWDPANDIRFLREEIELWFTEVIKRNLVKIRERGKATEVLAGLGIRSAHVEVALTKAGLQPEQLAHELRALSKPAIIAANKADLPAAAANFEQLKRDFPELTIVPCSAAAEIALRTAAQAGLISYVPGAADFDILQPARLTQEQAAGLELVRARVLKPFGSTGVQACLNTAVFDLLKYIVVYPVENESRWSDKRGNVLPDAYLLPPGSTARDLAFAIHTDIGKGFLWAVDARTKRRLAADHPLKSGDIIKIVSAAR